MGKKQTIILCAGYHGRVAAEILRLYEEHRLVGMLDDNHRLHNTFINGIPILGGLSMLRQLVEDGRVDSAVVGMGNIRLRHRQIEIYQEAKSFGVGMIQVIHPTAFVSPTACTNPGLFIGPHVVVNTGAKIGENVVVYTGSTIDHNSKIGDHVFISPGVHTAGQVRIDRGAYIGPGAVICSECVVGVGSVIGAGAVVTNDIPSGKLAFGVPARVQRSVQEWQRKLLKE